MFAMNVSGTFSKIPGRHRVGKVPNVRPLAGNTNTWRSTMEYSQPAPRRSFGVAALMAAGLVVFLLANFLVSYLNLRSAIDSQRDVVRSDGRLRAISKVLSVLQDAELGARGFVLTGNERYLQPYRSARGQIDLVRQDLSALVAGHPALAKWNQELVPEIDAELGELEDTIKTYREEGADAAHLAVQSGAAKRHTDAIRDITGNMERIEAEDRDSLQNVAERRIFRAIALMLVSTIFGLSAVALGFYLIQREIVARKQYAEALQEADRKKNDFLALVGHELRNPLAAITNAADVLHLLGTLDDLGEEMREIINRQTVFMSRLVNDLLDTARVAHGKLELRKVRLDLVELLRRTVSDARSAMQGGGVHIDLEAPAEPVWVRGDATRLAQIFGNLIDNAVKFSPRDGCVRVKLRTAEGHSQQATIEVVDEGAGIDPDALPSVFEPFVQAKATGDQHRRGLGLGLALARGLVELHGGQITARSQGLGRGTTMTVTLPLDRSAAGETESCAATPTSPGRCRVVVIDDRRDARYALQRILEISGHEVHVASDGPQGIELAAAVRADLVLCDIGLSGEMSGYDVVRELRQLAETRHAYIVAVTGYGQDDVRERAMAAGFHRHLIKPVSLIDLNQVIAELPCGIPDEQQTADSART